jgi:hypothetical protein
MTELTHLDEKLAEVLGLAQAAQTATKKAATLAHWEILAKFNETANDAEIDKNAPHGTAYLSSMRSRYAGTPCCGISPAGGRCRGLEL